MKAKLKPKTSIDYPDILVNLNGYFEFFLAFENSKGELYFKPVDKNWPSSTPIRESDLEVQK